MTLEIEETRSLPRLLSQASEWNDVLRTSGEDDLFLSLGWIRAWWETLAGRREMLVLSVIEDRGVVGFAPLMITCRGKFVAWRRIEFIGSGPSDRCAILAKEGREDVHHAVWDYLRSREGWDVIELRELAEGGPTERTVRELFPNAEYACNVSPYIPLERNYSDYTSKLSKNMRSNLSRYNRKLIQEQGATFRSLRSREELEGAVHTLKQLSDARWDIANVLKPPGQVEFIERAIQELAKEGAVVFHTLEVKDLPIAITMGFEYGQRYLYYLSGFDPEYSHYSPGSVLLSKIIEECHHRGLREVDLLRGGEAYKYRFNAIERHQVHFRTVNRGMLRSAEFVIREAPLS